MRTYKYYNATIITKLIYFCDKYCEVHSEFASNVKTQHWSNPYQAVVADMLMRSRVTIEGVSKLLPLLIENPHHKMSIFVLLRSQISDVLAYFCLLTFINPQKLDDTVAFQNESNLLDLDFVKAILQMNEEKVKLSRYATNGQILSSKNRANAIRSNILKEYKHLFNSDNSFKKLQQIRDTTDQRFFGKDKKVKNESLSQETAKFKRIMLYSDENTQQALAPAFFFFKYFSQYHHYSRGSMNFFKHKHLDHDMLNVMMCFSLSYIVCDSHYRQLLGENNKYSLELSKLESLLAEIST